jgi:hypothetical protein
MDTTDIIERISDKDADIAAFVKLALEDACIREEIVRLMVTHPHIMVYYHCFYVVDQATSQRPDLFYGFWDTIVPLLCHSNSYHRDFALTILANLAAVDVEDRFERISEAYLTHIRDEKFMTAQCFVKNCAKVIHYKSGLAERTIQTLLDVDQQTAYPDRQKELLKADILGALEANLGRTKDFPGVTTFVQACVGSTSPKTRSKAREMIAKFY